MKVAIVGGHEGSEMLAPFNDKEWEVWVLGNRHKRYPRISRVFEIHENAEELHGKEYIKMLENLPCEVVVSEKFPSSEANIRVFPYRDAYNLVGKHYLTSSFAYMISLAILDGATEIALYGVDLAVDNDEYFYQRPCAEGWMHYAMGRGIKVSVHENCSLGRYDYVYGRDFGGDKILTEPFTSEQFLSMAAQHHQAAEGHLKKIEELKIHIAAQKGAAQAYEKLAQIARATEAGVKVSSLQENIAVK